MKTRILFVLIVLSSFAAVAAFSQTGQRTVADGVYTEAQAQRGEALVRQIGCANCHGSTLEGGPEETPGLIGNEFINSWLNQSAEDLHIKVGSMPPENKTKRTAQENADILALLLWINGYKTGDTELSPDPAVLKQFKIVYP